MRQSDQNQIFEQIRCKNCSDIEFVGVDLHVRYGFNQIVYEVDKRQIHVHIPLPLGIMICTNLNQHYMRMLSYKLQLFWSNGFREEDF